MTQETGRANLQKVDDDLGLGGKLVANPSLLLDPKLAALAMISGMLKGRYRPGHTLAKYLPKFGPATLAQFKPARLIINPDNNGLLVARAALSFQAALQRAGMR